MSAKPSWFEKGRQEGFSAREIVLPGVLIIIALHLLITANTLFINSLTQRTIDLHLHSDAMEQRFLRLYDEVDGLENKAEIYVLTGERIQLEEYAEHAGAYLQTLAELESDLSDREQELLSTKLSLIRELTEKRTEAESYALTLAADAWETDLPEGMDAHALKTGEQEMTAQEKLDAARELLGQSYQNNGATLQDQLDKASARILSACRSAENVIDNRLERHGNIQWALTGAIVILLVLMCVMLFRQLLNPLEVCIRKIESGERISDREGMREFRRLAKTYNRVLNSRNVTEGNLRDLSVTDALTNLPNRLAFEQYIAQLAAEQPDSSLTVFSMDVNGLKQINDTLGHVYGDELLRKAAACIEEIFSDLSGKNCFRFGGDEFAAFWVDTPTSEIQPTLERFKIAQANRDITIAVGWAHTPKLGLTTVDALYRQADENMYVCKSEQKRTGKR